MLQDYNFNLKFFHIIIPSIIKAGSYNSSTPLDKL